MKTKTEIEDHLESLPENIPHEYYDNVDDAYSCGYFTALYWVLEKKCGAK